jgi:hypothetical protein
VPFKAGLTVILILAQICYCRLRFKKIKTAYGNELDKKNFESNKPRSAVKF